MHLNNWQLLKKVTRNKYTNRFLTIARECQHRDKTYKTSVTQRSTRPDPQSRQYRTLFPLEICFVSKKWGRTDGRHVRKQ